MTAIVLFSGCGSPIEPQDLLETEAQNKEVQPNYTLVEDTEEKEEKESYQGYTYDRYSDLTKMIQKIAKETE